MITGLVVGGPPAKYLAQIVDDIGNGQSVTGDRIAIDLEVQVISAHHALGIHAERSRHAPNHAFDLFADSLQDSQVGPGADHAQWITGKLIDEYAKESAQAKDKHNPDHLDILLSEPVHWAILHELLYFPDPLRLNSPIPLEIFLALHQDRLSAVQLN